MSTKNLVISAAPSSDASIVGTNLLYLHGKTLESLGSPKYITVNKNVFMVEATSKMKEGTLGLNKIQRESAKVSIGQTIEFESFVPPSNLEFLLSGIMIGFYFKFNYRIVFNQPKSTLWRRFRN
jgi:hypothetical protein